MKLTGQVAIVTGAGQGVGRSIAIKFAGAGASVVLVARTQAAIDKVAEECRQKGARALAIAADVADEAAVKAIVSRTLAEFGRLDVMVNNAGVIVPAAVVDTELKDWERVIATNLTGAFLFMKYCGREMMARRQGRIVNISSAAAKVPFPGFGTYAATKAGMLGITRIMADEMKPYNVRVNAINLGLTDTPAVRGRMSVNPDDLLKPEQIADVALFLASDASSGMTGTDLDVFGNRA
ncbi:MAG TPA: SDR family NAD(P)-dependent oxidoreductase [Bacillota bacterium]